MGHLAKRGDSKSDKWNWQKTGKTKDARRPPWGSFAGKSACAQAAWAKTQGSRTCAGQQAGGANIWCAVLAENQGGLEKYPHEDGRPGPEVLLSRLLQNP
jgi:hypothetical protein